MAHTHEFDCIVCGAHFDDEKTLQRHNEEKLTPSARGGPPRTGGANGSRACAKRSRFQESPFTTTGDKIAAPKFGSAGSGGAEYEPGPERD